MYWRFGHQNASVIDHLLESGNISLEELLEQDDLLQECKAHNHTLLEYLRDPAVLSQLLNYIVSDDLEDRARFKYPFIACEVIACEIWGLLESAMANIDMLVKFWEFLDRPPPLNPVQASYFAKVIGVFLMKKTSKMLEFIRSRPNVVEKLLLHMSTSAIMDLLLKIISMEEAPEGKGIVQWLSENGLMPWLIGQLDPNLDEETHSIASQVLLDIIAISQSSHPEQPSIRTNVLIDELKSEIIVTRLVGYMLDRTAPHSTSTLINGVTIFIELIRRNNSDYDVEPLPPGAEPQREAVDLSDLLKVLASRIEDFKDLLLNPRSVSGSVETSIGRQTPLGFERLKICEMFAELLHCSNMAILNSRPIISVSPDGTVKVPTVSPNYSIHSQPQQEQDVASQQDQKQEQEKEQDATPVKQEQGTAQVAVNGEESAKSEGAQENTVVEKNTSVSSVTEDQANASKELQSAPAAEKTNQTEQSDASEKAKTLESTGSEEDINRESDNFDLDSGSSTPKPIAEDSLSSSSPEDQVTPRATPIPPAGPPSTLASSIIVDITLSSPMEQEVLIPVGDFLKLQFVDHRIIPTCFDLFFQFPWNNFLHTVVYDMVHQVFHRPMGDIGRPDGNGNYIPPKGNLGIHEGWNRRLTISIFKDGQLTKRIADAQRLCDHEFAQPLGVRLGYMGHLTYIADETVKLLEMYQDTSLMSMLAEYIDEEDWWSYVTNALKETKERDAQVLGGSRPNMMLDNSKSLLDEIVVDDYMDDHDGEYGTNHSYREVNQAVIDGDTANEFARYLSQQIPGAHPDKFGSSDEDEDDEEGGWVGEYGQETEFDRRRAAVAAATLTDLENPFGTRHAMPEFDDSDEEENAEDDGWSPHQWSGSFGDARISTLGTSTQFNATLSDWSEDFQDGFTEFKSASAENKDGGFDFAAFKEGEDSAKEKELTEQQGGVTSESGSSTATATAAGVSAFAQDFGFDSDPNDPFLDNAGNSQDPTAATTTATAATDPWPATTMTNPLTEEKSGPTTMTGSKEGSVTEKAVDMEPVPLAPKVHAKASTNVNEEAGGDSAKGVPAAGRQEPLSTDSKSVSAGALSSESATAPKDGEEKGSTLIEPVPLADLTAPELKPTKSFEGDAKLEEQVVAAAMAKSAAETTSTSTSASSSLASTLSSTVATEKEEGSSTGATTVSEVTSQVQQLDLANDKSSSS